MDDVGGFLTWSCFMLAVGFFAGVFITVFFDTERAGCESSLPRDVECVWAAPLEYRK